MDCQWLSRPLTFHAKREMWVWVQLTNGLICTSHPHSDRARRREVPRSGGGVLAPCGMKLLCLGSCPNGGSQRDRAVSVAFPRGVRCVLDSKGRGLGTAHPPLVPPPSSFRAFHLPPPGLRRSSRAEGWLLLHQARWDQPWRLLRRFASCTAHGMTR